MSNDKLERFIIDHHDEFDDLEPNPAVWDRIQTREPVKQSPDWTRILWRAAAIAVIFVSSFIFIDYLVDRDRMDVLAESASEEPEVNAVYQELMEAEFYYSSQIEQRREEFYQLAGNNPALRKEINMELSDLDNIFLELKEDLNDNADNEEVVVAMIQNYRLKLEILEQILQQLQSANEKNKSHEEDSVIM